MVNIYCEGKTDLDILGNVIYGKSDVTIIPIGGKTGANAIITFNEGKAAKSDFFLFFRDRDFDLPVPATEELTFDGKKTYSSYRTTIENYLFDIGLFFKFIEERSLQATYNIHSENDVKNIFIETAKTIKDYQAVRHTLGAMRSGKATFGTTWTSGSGNLPTDLDMANCKTNAWNLIETAKNATLDWTEEKFNSILEGFLANFDELFFNDLKFLIYFQGKDFEQSLKNKLSEFPIKLYYKFAKENFDYTKFEDLKELRQIVDTKRHKTI
jgi:hypothetical protein